MRDETKMLFDLIDNIEEDGNVIKFREARKNLWDLGYRRLEPAEIEILEMLEGDTDINEIERFRNEEL